MLVQVADDSGWLEVEFQDEVVSKFLDGLQAHQILESFDISVKDIVKKVLHLCKESKF